MCLFQFWFPQCIMPSSGITGSYGSSISSFLRNFHSILHSGYTSLHPHQQCKRVPWSLHLFQHLLFVDILIAAILISVKCYLNFFKCSIFKITVCDILHVLYYSIFLLIFKIILSAQILRDELNINTYVFRLLNLSL